MKTHSMAGRLATTMLVACALITACSSTSSPPRTSAATSHRLTPGEVDELLTPAASPDVEHCADMAAGKMGISSCAEQAPPKSSLPPATPQAAEGDYLWDTSLPGTHLQPVHQPGVPHFTLLITRGIQSDDPHQRGLDQQLGGHYADLWASKHGMRNRDVSMSVPDQVEPVRVAWAGLPAGAALQLENRTIAGLPSHGAIIVMMDKGDLADRAARTRSSR